MVFRDDLKLTDGKLMAKKMLRINAMAYAHSFGSTPKWTLYNRFSIAWVYIQGSSQINIRRQSHWDVLTSIYSRGFGWCTLGRGATTLHSITAVRCWFWTLESTRDKCKDPHFQLMPMSLSLRYVQVILFFRLFFLVTFVLHSPPSNRHIDKQTNK